MSFIRQLLKTAEEVFGVVNKKKRKRQRALARITKAAARVDAEDAKKELRMRAVPLGEVKEVEVEADPYFEYEVAAQCGEGKPIFVSRFRENSDEELIPFVCRVFGVQNENAFTVLDIHKILKNGDVAIIRESADWPIGVAIIRRDGYTMRQHNAEKEKPHINATQWSRMLDKKKETKPAITAVAEVIAEKKIPRVPYTIKNAA